MDEYVATLVVFGTVWLCVGILIGFINGYKYYKTKILKQELEEGTCCLSMYGGADNTHVFCVSLAIYEKIQSGEMSLKEFLAGRYEAIYQDDNKPTVLIPSQVLPQSYHWIPAIPAVRNLTYAIRPNAQDNALTGFIFKYIVIDVSERDIHKTFDVYVGSLFSRYRNFQSEDDMYRVWKDAYDTYHMHTVL